MEFESPRGLGSGALCRRPVPTPAGPVTSGVTVPVRAAVDLAGLDPEDVRVEVVIGRVGASGGLEDTEVMVLPAVEKNGSVAVFAKEIVPQQTGRLGYALRISPNHYDDPLTRPCTSLLKWGTGELVPANTHRLTDQEASTPLGLGAGAGFLRERSKSRNPGLRGWVG